VSSGRSPLDDYLEQMRGRIPLRRFAVTDDVAAAAAFLASDDGAFISGAAHWTSTVES
jgi:NAD(P)-dependent dehydrogenase (short-subunit alcohol dehydrogenase family)